MCVSIGRDRLRLDQPYTTDTRLVPSIGVVEEAKLQDAIRFQRLGSRYKYASYRLRKCYYLNPYPNHFHSHLFPTSKLQDYQQTCPPPSQHPRPTLRLSLTTSMRSTCSRARSRAVLMMPLSLAMQRTRPPSDSSMKHRIA